MVISLSVKIFLSKEERKQRKELRKQKKLQKKLERKKKLSTRKWILPVVVVSIVVYAGLDVYIQLTTSNEISPTLTTCWFTFWAVELWNLASITKKKVDVDYETGYGENVRQLNQEDENDTDDKNDEEVNSRSEDLDPTKESEDDIYG